ncbi:MAG: DUF6762 family protein [Clostridiaceae bacterium]
MDFSALVLMERDKETKFLTKELGSYQVSEGAEYINKLFYDGEKINLYFDTIKDVLEWEYSAIFDLFNMGSFIEKGLEIEEIEEEYNPTYLVKFSFNEEHEEMREILNDICFLIKEEMDKVFENIKGKEEDYK